MKRAYTLDSLLPDGFVMPNNTLTNGICSVARQGIWLGITNGFATGYTNECPFSLSDADNVNTLADRIENFVINTPEIPKVQHQNIAAAMGAMLGELLMAMHEPVVTTMIRSAVQNKVHRSRLGQVTLPDIQGQWDIRQFSHNLTNLTKLRGIPGQIIGCVMKALGEGRANIDALWDAKLQSMLDQANGIIDKVKNTNKLIAEIKKATPLAEGIPSAIGDALAKPEVEPAKPAPPTADSLLREAATIMVERGKQYDTGEKERSFSKIAEAFNAVKGSEILKPSDVALLLAVLKMVRDQTTKTVHADSVRDLIAYAALYAELREQGE